MGEAFDYDGSKVDYVSYRQTDPVIEAQIHRALGDAQTILNVGGGAGSYEPVDRYVVAIEPSVEMRRKRSTTRPAVIGSAEQLPFDDKSFDASMAIFTIHHWKDLRRGLEEMRRVTRGPVVIVSCDPLRLYDFWMVEYGKEVLDIEARRYPAIDTVKGCFGEDTMVTSVSIPRDCRDGFQEAYYARPERLLDDHVRAAQSAWGFLSKDVEQDIVHRLRTALRDGSWDRQFGHFRTAPTFEGSLRLIISPGERR